MVSTVCVVKYNVRWLALCRKASSTAYWSPQSQGRQWALWALKLCPFCLLHLPAWPNIMPDILGTNEVFVELMDRMNKWKHGFSKGPSYLMRPSEWMYTFPQIPGVALPPSTTEPVHPPGTLYQNTEWGRWTAFLYWKDIGQLVMRKSKIKCFIDFYSLWISRLILCVICYLTVASTVCMISHMLTLVWLLL